MAFELGQKGGPKKKNLNLKPVLTWKTKVAQVKKVARGETIGYGRTFKTKKKTKIAILPVGYFEGYDRRLSNCGWVLIRGEKAPIVGRICMNIMMVDVSQISGVRIEEEVVLIGCQGKKEITADQLAKKFGTINYEIVSRINPQLPRRIVK